MLMSVSPSPSPSPSPPPSSSSSSSPHPQTAQHLRQAHHSPTSYSLALSSSSMSKGSGMTQLIRQKLNFTDETLWKRFSARRLELIDVLSLSEKKASEQDQNIRQVANQLRTEYSYPDESLPDFEKLLRAGIQSVRRNRKRVPKSKHAVTVPPGQAYHYYSQKTPPPTAGGPEYKRESSVGDADEDEAMPDADSDSATRHPNASASRTVMSISSLVCTDPLQRSAADSTSPTLPSFSPLSASATPPFKYDPAASIRLEAAAVAAFDSYSLPLHSIATGSAYKLLGRSILETSAMHAITKLPKLSTSSAVEGIVRENLLCEDTLRALARQLPSLRATHDDSHMAVPSLYIKVALCAHDRGFDWAVGVLARVFGELAESAAASSAPPAVTTSSTRLPPITAAGALLPSPVASAPASVCSTTVDSAPRIVPVTLRFFTRKLDFTYSPQTSTPPTVTEILENGRNAFQIVADQQVLKIRDLNTGRDVESDSDLEYIYSTRRIDLELYYPSQEDLRRKQREQELLQQAPQVKATPPVLPRLLPAASSGSSFTVLPPPKPVAHAVKLPPHIPRPKFQELL